MRSVAAMVPSPEGDSVLCAPHFPGIHECVRTCVVPRDLLHFPAEPSAESAGLSYNTAPRLAIWAHSTHGSHRNSVLTKTLTGGATEWRRCATQCCVTQ